MTFPAQFFTNNPEKQIIKDMLRLHPFVTCRNSKWKNSDYGTNVNPKYRADPNFVSFDMDCNKPTHHGGVCDNVGYALEATEGDGR
ncbi:MAG: hypothetical protein HAW59_03880 [Betaproteobacteria bacterium]|nr:hypothetical protein [Betaproteobacteria bacterium]